MKNISQEQLAATLRHCHDRWSPPSFQTKHDFEVTPLPGSQYLIAFSFSVADSLLEYIEENYYPVRRDADNALIIAYHVLSPSTEQDIEIISRDFDGILDFHAKYLKYKAAERQTFNLAREIRQTDLYRAYALAKSERETAAMYLR